MRIQDAANKILGTVKEKIEEHKETIDKLKEAAEPAGELVETAKDAFEAVKDKASHGAINQESLKELTDPTGKLGKLGKLKLAGGVAGTVAGVVSLPGAIASSVKDIRQAVRTGSRADIVQAAQTTLDAAFKATNLVDKGLTTAVSVNKLVTTYKAAKLAFKAAAPGVSEAVAKAAAKSAMKSTFEGATRQVARAAAREVVKDVAKAEAGSIARAVAGSASRAAAKATLQSASHAAVEAAAHAGAKAATGTLARAAGRFAPGLNIAMAAIDTGVAVATLADPKASTGKKITACITAVGSIAAATNIPIVSQVGAAVSTVSSIVGAFF